jgi:hypothetical protein
MSIDKLRLSLQQNQTQRIIKEKQKIDRAESDSILRHTTYQGDRKIQQLGGEIIENGVVLNNQSLAIGDVMMPLAKGNVLRRVDNTNGGALLGSAYREVLANNFDPNGNRDKLALSRNGGDENPDPFNPNNPNNPNPDYPQFPPPFGCTPPPSQCFWTTNPIAPDGFQGYGSAVVNENGVPLYLYCVAGAAVSTDLNCDFLSRWKCQNGVCVQDPNGIYKSRPQCEAALINTNVSFSQVFSQTFAPNLLITNTFSVNPPSQVSGWINVTCSLLAGSGWDDCGSIGSFTAPCTIGSVYIYTGSELVISSNVAPVNGTVTNLVVGGCSVYLNLIWRGQIKSCP